MVRVPEYALTLLQPWAWAVFHAGKDVENRIWWTNYRGPVWLTSSQRTSRTYYRNACAVLRDRAGIVAPAYEELCFGHVLGLVQIVDCILPGGGVSAGVDRPRDARRLYLEHGRLDGVPHALHPARWHFEDQYGYVLKGVVPLARPVPCDGHQRLWRVREPLLGELGRVLRAA
jgi:hypothetical protein